MKKCMLLLCVIMIANLGAVPVIAAQPATTGVDVSAKSAVLMEVSTGNVLYEHNPHEKLPIASVTKVMTMLIIVEAIDSGKIKLDDMVTCSDFASTMGGSQVYLEPGEQMTVDDMLKAIAVASGNDAAVAMAEHILGSESVFIAEMNKRAYELGMNNTNFINTNGLDAPNHYSSAYDVALMSRELMKHSIIEKYLTIWMDTLRDGQFGLANTNKLIKHYAGANGIKTGSTSEALYCLSAAAKRDGMQLISVVLGAPSTAERFGGASKLLDYGFANFAVLKAAGEGEPLPPIRVYKGEADEVSVVPAGEASVLVPKSKLKAVQKEILMEEQLFAPVTNGQKVGQIVYKAGDEQLAAIDIVTSADVGTVSPFVMFMSMVNMWLSL